MGNSTLAKQVSEIITGLLLIHSLRLSAQPSPWRLGFQIGSVATRSKSTLTPPIESSHFTITTLTSRWWQASIERNLSPYVSLKVGLGRVRLPYLLVALHY